MKWSKRLETIAEEVTPGAVMADIGTDHAYLPIRLKQDGICPHVILCDVSRGSLDKAAADWHELLPGEEPDLRLGDGLQVLEKGEADTVVMAGIGGILIADILEYDIEKARSIPRFILQPRSHPGYLRWRLTEDGFTIERERIAPEGKRLCEILTVSAAKSISPAAPDSPAENCAGSGTAGESADGDCSGDERYCNTVDYNNAASELKGLAAFQALDPAVQAAYAWPDTWRKGGPYVREYLALNLHKQQAILESQQKSAASDTSVTEAMIARLESLLQA